MKYLLVLVCSLFLTLNSFAVDKPSSKRSPAEAAYNSIYIVNSSVVTGCVNRLCDLKMKDLIVTASLFGMSPEVDETIAQLKYDKFYSCSARGGLVRGTKIFKVYDLSSCSEQSSKEFNSKISEEFSK